MTTSMMMDNLILATIAFVALLVVGIIFSRLYRRSSKERSFVRTGLGGQKVVMDGGAIVFPVFHEIILVNMNTLKLEVTRFGKDSLFTKDRMRVDVVVAFFVRVVPTKEGIANAAQTLGQRTMDPGELSALVEDKFVDSLRTTAVSMTMQELLDKRQDFIQGVQNAVSEDLLKNGLELESVSLTRIDQTPMQFFDPNNAFDAEGLTRLTEQTQQRSRERNEIEQDTTVAISKKNFEAKQLQLEIDRQKRFAELAQMQEVAGREAEQAATVAKVQAEKTREAEEAKIVSQRQIREAEVAKQQAVRQREVEAEREVQIASIEQQRATQIAEQNKSISIAQKSEEQSKAEASANLALAEAVKSEQAVKTAEEVARAEREKQVTLVLASQEAERQAIGVKVSAFAEKEASEAKADAIRTLAKANRENYEAEAAGKRALNEAINMLSNAQISLQEKLALIQGLPRIIEQAVKPMQNIDSIRIMQVDGLNTGAANAQAGDGVPGGSGGNLAEQAVGAALKYRAYAPVVDQLIKEVGLSGDGLAGLVKTAAPGTSIATVPVATAPAQA
ncbi:MAG TPA: flotillin family protein [Povalibacter sp.]|uniref:flotillin family protein n=2 Tax=Povalibacter sp. TaxID=1962978 RepID=UPI002BF7EFB4|nr:flotillin family protein [Povalibacter sp.]HMN44332.1 flotillin family protein [Povalibacter sp.]